MTILVDFEFKSRVVRKIIAVILPVVTTSFTLIPIEHPNSFSDELINDLLNLWINKIIKSSNFESNFRLFRNMFVHNNDVHYQSLLPSSRLEKSRFSIFQARPKLKTRKKWKIKVERAVRAVGTNFGWNTYSEHLTKLHSKLTKMTKIRIFRTKFQSPKFDENFKKTNLKLLKWTTKNPTFIQRIGFFLRGRLFNG